MEFQFSNDEAKFRDDIQEFVKKNISENQFGHRYEEETNDDAWDFAMNIAGKLADKKWLTISWPKEYGGMDASIMKQSIFKEEVGYWGIPGTTMGISGTNWVGPSIMNFGTDEQKKKYLPAIAAGDPDGVWCTGYSEPDSGTDLASLQTSAVRAGDEYIINGQKTWTSCAHRSRWCWLAVRTNSEVEKIHHGLSLIIVDMQSKGLECRPTPNLVGQHTFNELYFKEVRVPAENLVGIENNGWAHLMKALSFERGQALIYCGTFRRILDELLVYTKNTGLFDKAETRRKIAELSLDVEMLRMLAYESAWKLSRNIKHMHGPARDKAYADYIYEKLSRTGMDILGPYSMMDPLKKETPWTKIKGALEHIYWLSPGLALAAGATFTQRNIVGQFGLQLPRSY
jgi:alkylation response protein AidB-like acyl-CoA dehydrogenase